MDVALVTGTTSGIGYVIACRLLSEGWQVYGMGRDFGKCRFDNENFHPITCDLSNPAEVTSTCRSFIKQALRLDLLVNNAGVGYFGSHETIAPADIQAMVNVNLLAPMLLTRDLLRALRASKGLIINIGSTAGLEARGFGCAYSATKAGLKHFGDCLFAEARKQDVRVATISPDMTRTAFHDGLNFGPGDAIDDAISPETIADSVMQVVALPHGTVINDIVIRPQRVTIKHK